MASKLSTDIVTFLTTNPAITKLNFGLDNTFKVWPGAYQNDVAGAIKSEDIKVHPVGANGKASGASYFPDFDSLDVSPTFSTSNLGDQVFLVHECTHAYLDILNLGPISNHRSEALAYLAEAVFSEASGYSPLSTDTVRTVSRRIAKAVLAGTYWVTATDTADLVKAVAATPMYSSKVVFVSNGFKRSIAHNLLR